MSSSSSPIPHILLLGSTGFLGGSVLSFLLPNITISPPKYTISALVRSAEKAKWLETNNIRPVLGSLNDTALIEEEASKADILINTADSDHLPSACAAVAGLTKRFNQQQKKPLYLHTSGTGILISPTTIPGTLEAKIWSDANTASLASIPSSHLHRETDLFLLLPSHQLSIHITIIAPSAIHGMGLGPPALSNQFSVQIPWLVSNAIKLGKMHMVGRGENWSCQVHVRDLVEFYTHLLDLYPTGPTSSRIEVELPTGYCFPVPASSGGEVKMKDLVDALAKEMKAQGLLESAEVVEVDPSDESLKKVFGSSAGKWLVGGNCRVRGVEAESTGWVAKEEGVLGKEGLREVVREVGRAVSEGRYKGFGEGGSRSDGRYKD